jgi:hypothetical protein
LAASTAFEPHSFISSHIFPHSIFSHIAGPNNNPPNNQPNLLKKELVYFVSEPNTPNKNNTQVNIKISGSVATFSINSPTHIFQSFTSFIIV